MARFLGLNFVFADPVDSEIVTPMPTEYKMLIAGTAL